MPEVSVIIPTYNRADKIFSTITSVIKQTFTDIEIIIVNDGEDDKSVQDVIDKFDDKRIRLLRNQRKKGSNGARNTGLENANGKYIAFLDDDDSWYPDKIQKQIIKFNESSKKVRFVYSGFEIESIEKPGFSRKIFPPKKGYVANEIISGNFVGSPTPLIDISVFAETGPYDENLQSSQDWELWIRISEITEFEYVDEVLAKYVIHGNQISTDLNKKIISFDYIMKKHSNLYKKNKKAFASIYKKTAVLSLMNGRIKNCRERIIKALAIDWLRLDLIVHLILSFFPAIYRQYVDNYIALTFNKVKLIY